MANLLVGKAFSEEDFFFDPDYDCLGTEPYTASVIEKRGQFKLPPDYTRLTAKTHSGWRACDVYISFQMHADHLDTFLASTHITQLEPKSGGEIDGFNHYNAPQVRNDWAFDSTRTYLYGKQEPDYGATQYIAVEESGDSRLFVYVITFQN